MLFLFALLIRMRTAKAAGTIILTAISSVSAFLIGGSNYAAALFMCIILALSAGSAVYFVILRKIRSSVLTIWRHTSSSQPQPWQDFL